MVLVLWRKHSLPKGDVIIDYPQKSNIQCGVELMLLKHKPHQNQTPQPLEKSNPKHSLTTDVTEIEMTQLTNKYLSMKLKMTHNQMVLYSYKN